MLQVEERLWIFYASLIDPLIGALGSDRHFYSFHQRHSLRLAPVRKAQGSGPQLVQPSAAQTTGLLWAQRSNWLKLLMGALRQVFEASVVWLMGLMGGNQLTKLAASVLQMLI